MQRDGAGRTEAGGRTLELQAVAARMANCRVWTEGCTLRVRNNLRSYRVAAGVIAEIRLGWPCKTKLLGTTARRSVELPFTSSRLPPRCSWG